MTTWSPRLDRRAHWLALAALVPATEWLRNPADGWVFLLGILALIALVAGVRAGRHGRVVVAAVIALAATLAAAERWVSRVEDQWPAERERRVAAAFQRLQGELHASLKRADKQAEFAVKWADGDRAAAFGELDRALPRGGVETAIAILDPAGMPWAWAGRHRLVPEADGDSITARFSRFYATIESRRHSPSGRVAVASVLVWADSAVPNPERSLAAQFGASAGVQLRVFPPGTAQRGGDIFDYTEPTTAGERLLFSLQPVPPSQSIALDAVTDQASAWVGWGILLVLAVGLLAARSPAERLILAGGAVWCAVRSPLGASIGFGDLFSPATFFRGYLRPLSGSAGNLLVTGIALQLFAIWLWGQRPARRWWSLPLGIALLIGAPYFVNDLGRGITPPISGVTTSLWVTWQVTLTVATSAFILLAAALFRGEDDRAGSVWGVGVGVAIALAAAVVGVLVWQPKVGWPEWYTFLWAPALLLVARPAPRWAAIVGTAIVAGTAAALVTWGAEINGRVVAAQRDLARLGDIEDPLAQPLLERLSDQVQTGAEPTAASGMYLLWRASDLAGQEFPVRLALWERDGTRQAELSLDSLDLPTQLVAALVKGFDSSAGRKVVSLTRVPGRHYLLLQHLPSGRVLTTAVGPRTRLLAPTRLARLLRPPSEGPPLYDLSLSPPFTRGLITEPSQRWWRSGAEVRTDRLIDLSDGSRHVHAEVMLRPLPLLLVRGALLVSIDALILALLWLLATVRLPTVRQRLSLRRLARSFQVRLAVTLALFFVIPAVGFTIWGLGRLTAEANRTRDLLITAVLRDAVLTAGSLLQEPADYLSEGLADLSNRLDADLVLYSGGRLVAASAPLLEDLGLVEPLLDAKVYPRMALGDELELTRPATTYVAPVRVGYRVAQSGPPGGVGILATPQLAYDWSRSQDQRELTFLLLLATLGGLGAAMLGAQIAARALSRPVADLQRSAAALGQGLPMPAVQAPPAEFEQVFSAFTRMAEDVRASQAALDSARQRTAAVLANVATAVVALDANGAVLLANGRARQLLAVPLEEGGRFAAALGDSWAPLVAVVDDFLASRDVDQSSEVEVGDRTYRVQLARLGRAPGGSVLALDDLTDVTQAARVLAWGEMARQVAHEIKNPLTPIRLGMQHLRRVQRERPAQFDQVLEETSTRILSEIDRLDTIARAFSRFGLPGHLKAPLEQVDIAAVAREVAGLYRLTADSAVVEVEGGELIRVPARLDEVKEVLGNLLENARNAGARRVRIRVDSSGFSVEDDGHGIAAELLPRIFEPRFSTTTSGSGLGLAIVRRLVEGWGATVAVTSAVDAGTSVAIRWD